MGDRRKCQTFAASPAEPGGLPVMLVFAVLGGYVGYGKLRAAGHAIVRNEYVVGSNRGHATISNCYSRQLLDYAEVQIHRRRARFPPVSRQAHSHRDSSRSTRSRTSPSIKSACSLS